MFGGNMNDALASKVINKIAIRTVPLLAIVYFIAFLDRVNIGFAAITMNDDLGITATMYGMAAGVFFFGYVLFQVPSNVVLARIGARRWLPILAVFWGVVSMMMAFVTSPTELYVARFLLGVAEAGFLPGVVFYLTMWFPPKYRARVVAGVVFAFPMANILGSPLSAYIMEVSHGWLDFRGWQWLFIIEGFPALLGAAAILLLLPDNPKTVPWLEESEKKWLLSELEAANEKPVSEKGRGTVWATMFHPITLILCVAYLGIQIGQYGIVLWLPLIVKESGVSLMTTGWLSAIPYLVAAFAMLYWSAKADKASHDARYLWLPFLVATICLIGSGYAPSLPLRLALLTIATAGIIAPLPTFWAFASRPLAAMLPGVGIAMINSFGTSGGFIGPYAIGWVRDATQSFQIGLITVGVCLGVSAVILMIMGKKLEHRD